MLQPFVLFLLISLVGLVFTALCQFQLPSACVCKVKLHLLLSLASC